MAWTTPRDWTGGEFVTEAMMDTHVRDNQLAMGPHLIVRKPSDESVASSTTPQNDDHLLLSVGASEVWLTQWIIRFTAVSTAVGIKLSWAFPASGAVSTSFPFATAAGTFVVHTITGSANPSTALDVGAPGSGTDVNTLVIPLIYIGAGSAGTLQLMWAQISSKATATVVKANSTLWAVKLA